MEFVKPPSKTPAPGREVDAYCARCKMEMAHVIVAMDGARIAKAQCNTCRSVHGVRKTQGAAKTYSPRPRPAGRVGQKGLTHSEWDRLVSGRDLSRSRRYDPTAHFAAEAIVDHPQFGLGVVTKLLSDRKIEVAFKAGLKILVHDRA